MEPTPEREQHARPHERSAEGGDSGSRNGIGRPPGRLIPRGLPVERRTGEPTYRPEIDGPCARSGRGSVAGGRAPRLFAVLLIALLVLSPVACGEAERGDAAAAGTKAEQGTNDREDTAAAKPEGDDRGKAARAGGSRSEGTGSGAGETDARSGEARADAGSVAIAGSTTKGPGGDARGETSRKVALEITGERGTRFSGVCKVGRENRALDGRAPERYVFEPRGKKLECSLSKKDGDVLSVVLSDGAGVRSEQRISGGESSVRLVYSNGGVSSTTTSSVSKSQTVTSSGGSP